MLKKADNLLDVRVVGVGMTRFGELWEDTLVDLACEAGSEAIKDAGLLVKDIDAVVVGNMLSGNFENQGHLGTIVSNSLGIMAPSVRVEGACASGGLAVRNGVEKLVSGMAKKVLVIGVEKMTDLPLSEVARLIMGASGWEEQFAGMTFPGIYALITLAYKDEYGVRDSEISAVAVKNHAHGVLNPKAHFRFDITLEGVARSARVATPIRLLDCSPISDGAAAVVLSSSGGSNNGAVRIMGLGQGVDSVDLARRESLTSFKATKAASFEALKMASMDIGEVEVVEVHDCFSIGEIIALEDMGFVGAGKGWELARDGHSKIGGKLPVNTSGGLKACGHPLGATGVKQIVELVLQLRGVAGERQVEGAKVGLAHNVGGAGGTAVVSILRAD